MISLYDILEAADGQLFGEPAAQIFSSLAFNLDQVEPGCLFAALQTEQGDGHRHIPAAIDRGATGVVCMQAPTFDTEGVTVIIVRDSEQAVMNWARVVMGKYGTTVIAVAGAVGKSTAREAIAAVLGTRYEVYSGADRCCGRLGLPQALAGLTEHHQLAVLELPSDRPGVMADMVDIVQPLVGVIIGTSPGEEAAQPDEIEALLRAVPENGLTVLNFDDSALRSLAEQTAASVFSIGVESFDADLMAYNIVPGRYKTGFDLRYGTERVVGRWTPLLGAHQLYAVMAALAVGLSYQVSLETALDALKQLDPLPGRMQPLRGQAGCLLIDDTFSGGVGAAQAALGWLAAQRGDDGRLIFVLGELEASSSALRRVHREIGRAAGAAVDLLITEGRLAALAGQAARDEGVSPARVRMVHSPEDVVAVLAEDITPGDIVLAECGRESRLPVFVRQFAGAGMGDDFPRRRSGLVRAGEDRRAWVEVDLPAVAENIHILRDLAGPGVDLMAVVAADAFGHGAVPVSTTAIRSGAVYLAVDTLEEGAILRDAGIDAPILVMGVVPTGAVRDALAYDLTFSLPDVEFARFVDHIAGLMGVRARAHLNVDTGMGRFGLLPGEVSGAFRRFQPLAHLRVEGVYTEPATVGEDARYLQEQLAAFEGAVLPLRAAGIDLPYIHALSAAAMLSVEGGRFSLVRAGGLLHGIMPQPGAEPPPRIRPTLAWKTTIAQVKAHPRGQYIGSSKGYRTRREERIAVIPVGYADGLRGRPGRWQQVLVRGARAAVVGNIGMHQATLSLAGAPDVRPGDEVVLLGGQDEAAITVAEAAGWLECSAYELLSGIMPRR